MLLQHRRARRQTCSRHHRQVVSLSRQRLLLLLLVLCLAQKACLQLLTLACKLQPASSRRHCRQLRLLLLLLLLYQAHPLKSKSLQQTPPLQQVQMQRVHCCSSRA